MLNQAAERLRRNVDEIMRRWEVRAYKEVAAATHQESLALRDSLPEYLGQLADALSTTIDRTEVRIKWDREQAIRVGRAHGRERASSLDYTLDQLIFEYQILRQVICEVMEKEAPLSPVEREIIVCSIEQTVNDAATQFSETLRDIQEQVTHALAHDLRTPLAAAKTGALLIMRHPDDVDRCIEVAGRISANIDKLDGMISHLLDASRLRAGETLPLKFEECDLDVVVRQAIEELNFTHGNRVVVEAPAAVAGYWDAKALQRALENLVINAIKYGEADKRITVRLTNEEGGVTIAVHNEGKPIPPEEQAILFQQYRRARSLKGASGWGLGLTVVKGIVEGHRGSIGVESAEGKGTTFIVHLPVDSRH